MISTERLMTHWTTKLGMGEAIWGRTVAGVRSWCERTEACHGAWKRICRLWGHLSQHSAHTHGSHATHAGRRIHVAGWESEADWESSVGSLKICKSSWSDGGGERDNLSRLWSLALVDTQVTQHGSEIGGFACLPSRSSKRGRPGMSYILWSIGTMFRDRDDGCVRWDLLLQSICAQDQECRYHLHQ